MKNFCLGKKISNKKIELLGSVLSTGPGDYSINKQMYDDIAYMLLSANGGYPLSQDPWGRPSAYWKELEKIHSNGIGYDVRAVVLDKAYIYMDEFVSKYGDWYLEDNGHEPDFVQTNLVEVVDPLTSTKLKKLNVDMYQQRDAMNDYLLAKTLDKYYSEDIKKIQHRQAFAKYVIEKENQGLTHEEALKEILNEKLQLIRSTFNESWGAIKGVSDIRKNTIRQIREFIDIQLSNYANDYKRVDVILAMITQLTSPYCQSAETLSKPLIEKWIEALKGTEEFRTQVLEEAPKSVRPSSKYKNLSEEAKIDEYSKNLLELLTSKDNLVFHQRKINESVYSWFYNLINSIRRAAGWTITCIPRVITGNGRWFTRESVKRKAVRNFIIDITNALCATEGLLNNENYTQNQMVLNSFKNASSIDIALDALRKNIIQRLKALDREQAKELNQQYRDLDIVQLNSLKLKVDEALKSDELLKYQRSDQFFNAYVENCIYQISHALEFLDQCKLLIASGNTDQIDPNQLMYIKNDMIGGFACIFEGLSGPLSGFNLGKIPLESFRDENGIRSIIKNSILDQMSILKNDFGQILDIYVNDVINNRIHNTVGKYLDEDHEKTFKDCVQFWIHLNPTLNMFDTHVFSASTSESPVVRMVTDMLHEIEAVAEQEAQQWGAELNRARRDGKGSLFLNLQKRLAERTKSGHFSGYLNTEVNKGEYLEEIRQWNKDYIKSHKLPTVEGKDYIDWDQCDEDLWKWYNIHLLEFMGNCSVQFDSAGNPIEDDMGRLSIVLHGRPRSHRRFKAQYYIQRYYTLSRDAFELRQSINNQMYDIEQLCLRSITYTKNGKDVTVKVPIIQQLEHDNPEMYDTYKQLMLKKFQLASVYEMQIIDGNVVSLSKKTDPTEIRIAQEFLKLHQIEAEYSKDKTIIDRSLYDAIILDYLDRIKALPTGSEEQKQLKIEYSRFKNYNNSRRLTDRINDIVTVVNEYDRSNKPHYDQQLYSELLDLLSTRNAVKRAVLLDDDSRTPDLKKILPDVWKELLIIDKRITEIETLLKITPVKKTNPLGSYDRSDLVKREDILVLQDVATDEFGNPRFTGETMYSYLLRVHRFSADLLEYIGTDKQHHHLNLLRRSTPTNTALTALNVSNSSLLYEVNPIGSFVKTNNAMLDLEYDDSIREREQIDKQRYANAKYDDVKNDPLYKKVREAINEINKCYTGRDIEGESYMLPLREAKPGDVFWRSLPLAWSATKTKFHSIWGITTRDEERFQEEAEQVLRRADNTIIDSLPVMYMLPLDNPSTIDLDLVSSVTTSLQEAIRYKYRKLKLALLEAMRLYLQGGISGVDQKTASDLLKLIDSEIARGLYGRNTKGSGEGGRLTPFEKSYAKLSLNFRSVIHQRLMGHNWMSVLKNGWDSFCNLIQTAVTGLYFKPLNILRGLWRMLKNIFPAISSYNRPTAITSTQAFMQYNGTGKSLPERFSNTHLWYAHRLLSKTAQLEFEFVDYTAKAAITEAVYDAYRLVYNPISNKHEYMNASLAELVYLQHSGDRSEGYYLWDKAKKYTLRNAYTFNKKLGTVSLRTDSVEIEGVTYKYEDLVRPVTKYGIKNGRSYVLENTVRNTIRQISSTVNGMLEQQDKNAFARDYRGALAVAFRGWMISQGGLFYKYGRDFYQYDQHDNMSAALATYGQYTTGDKGYKQQLKMRQFAKTMTFLHENDFMGMYNFNTGTIDRGLHRDLIRILKNNAFSFIKSALGMCYINAMTKNHKNNWLKKRPNASSNDYYVIQNMACATNLMMLTIFMCMLAYSWYDSDPDDWFKSLIYTGKLASIAERFSQVGFLGGFGLSLAEILNSLSVGTSVASEFVLMAMLAIDLIRLWSGDNSPNDIINRGSFTGYSELQKHTTYSLTLLSSMLGVDDLSIELALDLLLQNSDKQMLSKYNVNFHKNTSAKANRERGKWYSQLEPVPMVKKIADMLDMPIYPNSGRRSSSGSQSLDDLNDLGSLNDLNSLGDLSSLNSLNGL